MLSSSVFGQSVVKKLHAYYRDVLPGIVRVKVDEKGNPREEEPGIRKQYLIYVETRTAKAPVISSVFIDGRSFTVKIDTVHRLPVIIDRPNINNRPIVDTLVQVTTNHVWTLAVQEGGNKIVPQKYKNMQLLLVLGNGKKKTYLALRKMKRLEPLALM